MSHEGNCLHVDVSSVDTPIIQHVAVSRCRYLEVSRIVGGRRKLGHPSRALVMRNGRNSASERVVPPSAIRTPPEVNIALPVCLFALLACRVATCTTVKPKMIKPSRRLPYASAVRILVKPGIRPDNRRSVTVSCASRPARFLVCRISGTGRSGLRP
jgi:hypothetical protein